MEVVFCLNNFYLYKTKERRNTYMYQRKINSSIEARPNFSYICTGCNYGCRNGCENECMAGCANCNNSCFIDCSGGPGPFALPQQNK